MKGAVENEEYDCPRSKRFRLAEGSEDLPLPTEIEAQSYLISVKEHFKNDRAKYAEFIQILNDFRSKTCDTIAVITKLKRLFKSHELLMSFNKFLPKGFEILFPFKEFLRKENKVEFGDAIRYIKKIKTRFENEDNILKGFFDIMNACMKGNKMINNIHTEVKLLFGDHQDLVDEFAYFLPDSASSFLVLHFQAGTDSHRQEMSKGQKYLPLDNKYHQSSQLAVEKNVEGTPDAVVNEHSKKGEKEKQCKEEDITDNRPARNMKSEIYVLAQDYNRRNSKSSSEDFSVRQRHMSPTEDSTGKHTQQGVSKEPSETLRNNPELLDFFEKVKTNFGNVAYREIVKCISMYNAKVINTEHLQHLAVSILGKCPEVVDELNEMISRSTTEKDVCRKDSHLRNDYRTEKGEGNERNSDGLLGKENERMKDTDCEENKESGRREEKDKEGHKDQHDESRVVVIQNEEKKGKDNEEEREGHKDQNHKSRDVIDGNASTVPNNDKITFESISEMNLSKWEQCTPSYRLLPQNFVRPIPSCSSSVAAEVLNDICLSVPFGTEDYRKQKRVNSYEEAIFKCEDDRYEMDMLIETSKAAIMCVCELLEKKHEETSQINAHFRIEDHLTDMDLRCIERIYGDCGLLIIDLLREKPNHCLPVIVKRLQQKRDEWINCRNTFNIGWADVYAKNYQRSLDHITFSCKQRDKKITRTHLDL